MSFGDDLLRYMKVKLKVIDASSRTSRGEHTLKAILNKLINIKAHEDFEPPDSIFFFSMTNSVPITTTFP